MVDEDEVRRVATENIALQTEVSRLKFLVDGLTSEMEALRTRSVEWEQFFHEHKASRDEGYEAARSRYWPKVEAARADTDLLKKALLKLIEAARDVPPTAALGSMIVNSEFSLTLVGREAPPQT
jgi:hypothetical protein